MIKPSRRRFLRSTSIAIGATAIGTSEIVSGRKRYPTVENPYTDKSVSELAVETAKQPHHNRVAFTSTGFEEGFELYMATEASSVEDSPSKVLRLTDNTNFGVYDLAWENGNKLQYHQDGITYRLKIPQSNKVFTPKQIGEVEYPGLSDDASKWAPKWWVKRMVESEEPVKDVELVSEGVTDWISADDESPNGFTINGEDELKYKPHGVFRKTDTKTADVATADVGTTAAASGSAELCSPTSIKVGPVTVGIEACHYGGCEWKVSACAVACISTGMNDNCDGYYGMGGDIGVVDADLNIYPEGELLYPGTVLVLTGIKITRELCYYYVIDSDCKSVSINYDFF